MNSIDQRIVSMRFDNAQFEAGARESLKTLDTLKNSLNLEESSKGLRGFSVAPVLEGLNGLAEGFNALDVVAITVISNITSALMDKLGNAIQSTIGQIYSGGLRRAQNLEQARFAMRGLLYDTDAAGNSITRYGFTIEDVMGENGPVQNSVRGTAYGLDEAAKAASNFIASGITDLGDLENTLKSISGTAAQTGSSFEDIAHIYTRIAGNNRLYAIDLQSFAARGVNAAAAIRDYLNKIDETANYTEADIRELVSEGVVNLDMFAKAMYEAFGDNAFRANETYSGSLSNLNAALSRVGAKFESAKLERMTDIFNSLRLAVDAINAAIDPLIQFVVKLSASISSLAVEKIDGITKYFKGITDAEKEAAANLADFDYITQNMSKVEKFDAKRKWEEALVTPFDRLAMSLNNVVSGLKNIGSFLKNIFSPISSAAKKLIGSLFPITPTILKISEIFLKFTEGLAGTSDTIVNAISKFKDTNKYFLLFESAIKLVSNAIKVFAKNAKNFIKSFLDAFGPVFTSIIGKVLKFLEPLAEKLTELFNRISEFVTSNLDFSAFADSMSEAFSWIIKYLDPVNSKLANIKDTIIDFFKSIVDTIHEVLSDLTLQNVFGWILDFKAADVLKTITGITNPIGTAISTVEKLLKDNNIETTFDSVVGSLRSRIRKVTGKGKPLFRRESLSEALGLDAPISVGKGYGTIAPILDAASTSVTRFGNALSRSSIKVAESYKNFTVLDKIRAFLDGLWKILERIGSKIGEAFSKIGQGIKDFFSGFTLSNISAGILTAGMGGLLYELFKFLDDIRKIPKNLANSVIDLCKAVEDAFISLEETFGGIKHAAILKSVKSFAIAILILVVALKLLTTMDFKTEVLPATGGLLIVITELSVAFTLMSKFAKTGDIKGIGPKLLAFSAAVLIMAMAVKALAGLDRKKMITAAAAIGGITLCILAYSAVMALINREIGDSTKGTAVVVSMGISVLLMAKAIKTLGSIKKPVFDQGMRAVEELILLVSLYSLLTKKAGGVSQGAGIILMATSLYIFAGAIQVFALLKEDAIKQGLGLMATVLFFVGFYLNAIESTKPMQAAIGLLIMSAALIAIAGAIMVLGTIPVDKLNLAGIAAMCAGLFVVAGALKFIGSSASIKSALAIVIVSAALLVLANALLVLSFIPFTSLASNVLIIVGALAVLGMLSGLIAKAALALSAVSSAIAILGLGILAIAVAMTLMTPVMAAFSMAFLGSLTLIVQGIIEMKDQLAKGLAALFEIILTAFRSTIDLFVALIVEFLTTLLEGFTALIEPIVNLLKELFMALIAAVSELIPFIADAFLDVINGILITIGEHISEIVQAGMAIATEFMNGISAKLPDLIDAGFNLIITYIEALATAIDENAERLGEAAWHLIKALVMGLVNGAKGFFKEPVAMIKDLGKKVIAGLGEFFNLRNAKEKASALMNGLGDGIGAKIISIVSKIASLGSRMINKLKEFVNFNKLKEIGANLVKGVMEGITSFARTAVDKIKEFGTSLLNGFKSVLGIRSPSTKFKEAGNNVVEGVNDGLKNNSKPLTTIGTFANNLLSKFTGLFSKKKGSEIGSGMVSGISAGISGGSAGSAITTLIENLKKKFNKSKDFEDIGLNLMNGLVLGIKKGTPKVVESSGHTANSIVKRVRNEMEVKSPSRVFMRIGEYCMEGLAIGIGETGSVEKKVDKLKDILTDGLESKITDIDTTPTITPILDLSEVQNGMTTIDSLIGRNQMIGSISANINGSENQILSAINALTNRLNQKMEESLTPEEIYDAIRFGAANAKFTVLLNGKSITSVVNDRNSDLMDSGLGFI